MNPLDLHSSIEIEKCKFFPVEIKHFFNVTINHFHMAERNLHLSKGCRELLGYISGEIVATHVTAQRKFEGH